MVSIRLSRFGGNQHAYYHIVVTDSRKPRNGRFLEQIGTYDPAKRTFTGWFEGPDMTGKVTKTRGVTEYKDKNNRVFSMYAPGPDGKEALGMRITYKRKM